MQNDATEITWSAHQNAFYDELTSTRNSIMLVAVAGAGKSTTIVEGVSRLPHDTQVLFLAFNKAIAKELEPRMPGNARAKTFHSVGFTAWARINGGFDAMKVDEHKVRNIIRDKLTDEQNDLYGAFVARLVAYAKTVGVGKLCRHSEKAFRNLVDHFGLYIERDEIGRDPAEVEAEAITKAMAVLEASNAMHRVIDYNDMLYLPLMYDVRFYENDVVFVDEAQDTNSVQLALLKRMVKPGGRVIAVGDPAQAIYGFRGASSSAMEKFKTTFGMVELPLTVSYRCAQAVVVEAQRLVDHIQAAPTAPQGAVFTWEPANGEATPAFAPGDAILCRTTAPLFKLAYQIIASGTGCRILGREIGEGLVNLIKKMQARDVDGLLAKLERFEEREVTKLLALDKEAQAEAIKDRIDCIRLTIDALPENNRTVGKLVEKIRGMFEAQGKVTTLCTVHKAKGLEWERVYILRPDLMPHPMARKPWEQEQEVNLQYVAITRAKRELIYLPDEDRRG